MPWGERPFIDPDITPTITEKTLTNNSDVTATGNLGGDTAWMILEALDEQEDGKSELEADVNSDGGDYSRAVSLLNQANFENVSTSGLSGNLTLKNVSVNGGMVNLRKGHGIENLTITGTATADSGFLGIDGGDGHTTVKGPVTYRRISNGELDGDVTFENGVLIDGHASVDLSRNSSIKGNITIKSKGSNSSPDAFSDLEKQYGVWGVSIEDALKMENTDGGLNVDTGSSTIDGDVNINGGSLSIDHSSDYGSGEKAKSELTVEQNVSVTNAGEIRVRGTKDRNGNGIDAKLTIEKNLTVSDKNSLVTVGSRNIESQGELIVNGTTTVKDDGKIIVGQNGIATFNGEAILDGTNSLVTNGNGTINLNGKTTINKLTLSDTTTDYTIKEADVTKADLAVNNLTVGNGSFKNSKIVANGKTTVNGTTKLDPSTLTTSSLLFDKKGKLAILTGSATYVGDSSSFASTGTGTVAEGSALLALASGISLGNTNAIYVSGTEDNDSVKDDAITANSVTLKKGATLSLHDGAFSHGAAITFADGNGTFTVEDGAKIVLEGKMSSTGEKTVVTGAADNGFHLYTDTWSNYLSTSSILYKINNVTTEHGKYVVDIGMSPAGLAALSSGISSGLSNALINNGGFSEADTSLNNGYGFISQLVNHTLGSGSSDEVRKFRDEANSFTGFIFGGVPLLNIQVAQIAHDNVEQRNGFSTSAGSTIGNVQGNKVTVWTMPFYKGSKSDSFKIEGSEYGLKSKIYGLSLGADFEVANGFRLGFDGIIGHATTDSRGDLDPSDDSASFWGLGAYGTYDHGNLRVLADIGYTAMNTDTNLHTSYGTIYADDTGSYTFTAGINAKYKFNLSYVDVTPHVGIRYNHAKIDSYKANRSGSVLLSGDSISQNYFQFPMGVELSKQFTAGAWELKPVFDVSAVFTAGDKDLDADAVMTGFNENYGKVSTNAEVLDPVSFRGSLGFDAKYGALGLGVGYSFTGSKNVKDHVFAAGVNYAF